YGKKLAAISGSVNAARERRLTRISKILVVIPVLGKIGLRVQPPDGRAGNSREARMPVLIEIDARTRSNRLLRSFFERGCKRLFRPLLLALRRMTSFKNVADGAFRNLGRLLVFGHIRAHPQLRR